MPAGTRADETPRTGVIDEAGVVDAGTKARIDGLLLELENKTGAQLKVWTMASTNGRDPYSLAIETARKWRLGQHGKNNGCLVLIAVKDHKWRIVTGEGIEDVLPDVLCDQIASTYFVPYFRKGDYSQGILLGTAVLAQTIAQKEKVQLTGLPAQPPQRNLRARRHGGAGCGVPLILVVFFLILVANIGRLRRRGYYRSWGGGLGSAIFWSFILSGSGRGRGSGGSGWGSSGFGGGGFGGGGGGSFGGGGAGGSW